MRATKIRLSIPDTPPQVTSIISAVIVSTLLCVGFPWMVGSAFVLNTEWVSLIFSSLFASAFYAGIHYANKKRLSIPALILVPAVVFLIIYCDGIYSGSGLETILSSVQYYVLYSMPGNFRRTSIGVQAVTTAFETLNHIHACVITYVVIKRKGVWVPLVLFAPYFLIAVGNVVMVPCQAATVTSAAGVILLLLVGSLRSKVRETAEKMLIRAALPVLIFTIIVGAFFPSSSYDKDKLAENTLLSLKELSAKLDESVGGTFTDIINQALNGKKKPGELEIETINNQYASLYSSSTDLSRTGPFDPPSYKLFTVFKDPNADYNGTADTYSGNYMYLKLDSMDIYEDNLWSMSAINMDPYAQSYFTVYDVPQYTVTIDLIQDSDIDILPCYTDFYRMTDNQGYTTVNPYNYSDNGRRTFHSSPVPVRCGDVFSEEYLDKYVYGTALEVPEETRQALIDSGVLPDWYIDAINGTSAMSDVDKIRAVTDYVRSLHPYDKNTAYPPDGADFVVWFITDAETGICVHYASASVILLRMLGIPARYVDGFLDSGATAGVESEVYSTEAHSWFEVFVPEYGWIVGDATPGNEGAASHYNIDAACEAYPDLENAEISIITISSDSDSADPVTSEPSEPTITTDTTDMTTETTTPYETTSASETSETTVIIPDGGELVTPGDPDETTSDDEAADSGKTTFVFSLDNIPSGVFAAFFVILALGIARFVYVLVWMIKLSVKDNRERAIAYYRYFRFMGILLRTKLPKKATAIAEKAAFSNEEISKKDVDILIETCKKSSSALSAKLPAYKRIPYRFFEIKV